MQLGDSSKKIHPDTPPEDFLHMFTFSNTPQSQRNSHHLPKPSCSGSIRNLPGLYITTKPIGKNHQTKPSVSEDTKVTWNRNQGGDCDFCFFFSAGKAMDFWRILFLPNQNRGDWIGFVGKWKKWMEVVGHVFFFFCNLLFLLQVSYCKWILQLLIWNNFKDF